MREDASQRTHPLRELFNALRWFVRAGCPWRMLPNDLPPWTAACLLLGNLFKINPQS